MCYIVLSAKCRHCLRSLCVILYYWLSVVTEVSVCYIVLSAKCCHCLRSLCVILYYRLSVVTV